MGYKSILCAAFALTSYLTVAQSFPSAIATDAQLMVATNNGQSVLRYQIGESDTTIVFPPYTTFPSYTAVTIGNEIIRLGTIVSASGVVTASNCVRGFDGTTKAAHAAGSTVKANIVAAHHNGLRSEIEAIETALGPNLSNIPGSTSSLIGGTSTEFYSFSRTLAVPLGVGVNLITLAPFPTGLNGSDTNHYLRITDGVNDETVLVTGGAGTSGSSSGTLAFSCAFSHSAGAFLKTATDGIQEAVNSLVSDQIAIPAGIHNIYAATYIARPVTLTGVSMNATQLFLQPRTINFINYLSHTYATSADRVKSLQVGQFSISPASLASPQTSGAVLFASGPNANVETTWIKAIGMYQGIVADWTDGALRANNCWFQATTANAVFLRSTNPSLIQLNAIYADGDYGGGARGGPLLKIFGTLAGGTINNLYFQASQVNVQIEATAANPVNELVISNSVLDQDSNAVANINVHGTGTNVGTSNSIRFDNVYVSTDGYGVLIDHVNAVKFANSYVVSRSAVGAPISILDSSYIEVLNNKIIMANVLPTRAILLSGSTGIETWIKGNNAYSATTNVQDFVYNNSSSGGNVYLVGNSITGFDHFVAGVGAVGTVRANGNTLPSLNYSIADAATITLVEADVDQIEYITGSGTPITRILGGYPYRQVKLITVAAITFSTGGANPGNIAVAKTTVAGQMVIATFNPVDGLWYLN